MTGFVTGSFGVYEKGVEIAFNGECTDFTVIAVYMVAFRMDLEVCLGLVDFIAAR